MVKVRRTFLRVLTLVLVAFIAVAFTSMMARPVNAEEEPTFALIQGASIRNCTDENNPIYGLKYETKVSKAWLSANRADKYSFGTLIFPTDNIGNFVQLTEDSTVEEIRSNLTTNKNALDAIKFIADMKSFNTTKDFVYDATITYTYTEVETALKDAKTAKGESYTAEDLVKEVEDTLKRAYKREFTAISYVEMWSGENEDYSIVYSTNTHTDSMERVAMRLQNDPEWAEVAKNYLPNGEATQVEYIDGYAINGNGTLEVNDFTEEDHSKDFDLAGLTTNFTLDSKVLVQGTDYIISDNVLKFTGIMAESLGKYRYLYAFDNDNNLFVIKVLFAHEVLTSASQIKEAFDYGVRDFNVAKYEEHNKAYVLGKDIDMTGVIIENAVMPRVLSAYGQDNSGNTIIKTSDATEAGFAGIFDGRGFAIHNATVEMSTVTGIQCVKENGDTDWTGEERRGFFHTLKPGSVVKNVAFINLVGNNKVGASAIYGLGGLLSFSSQATIENIYVDITSSPIVRGPFGDFDTGASLKNAVISFTMPEGYDFSKDYPTITTDMKNAYSYGSLTGAGNSNNFPEIEYENVQVISKAPIFARTDEAVDQLHDDTSEKSTVWYAENETKLLYEFSVFDSVHGDVEHTVKSTEGVHTEIGGVVTITGKTRVAQGIRRYNDNKSLVADVDNASKIESLVNTGMFKVSEGYIVWHSEKPVEKVDTFIEYDANLKNDGELGKFLTTDFDDKDIQKIVVKANGSTYELTTDNAGFTKTYENGFYSYKFNKQTSYTDQTVGMPYIDASKADTQIFSMEVHLENIIYNYTNLCYWTTIISNAQELKSALDMEYTAENRFNYGFYKLDADIDLTGVEFEYTGYSSMYSGSSSQNQTHLFGFMGQFDGCGYSLKNLQNGKFSKGIFGNFVCDTTQRPKIDPKIQNLAVINWAGNSAPVFGVWVNNHNVYFENLYVTYNSNAVPQGIIGNPYAGYAKVNNVYVNDGGNGNSKYSSGAIYGDASGKGLYRDSFYAIDTLFSMLRWAYQSTDDSVTNFISVGYSPLVNAPGRSNYYNKYFTATKNTEDNTYSFTLRNTGVKDPYIEGEVYSGYAGNETVGGILQVTGLKPEFVEYAKNEEFGALPGYYCAACYKTFQADAGAGECTACGATLTQAVVNGNDDLWRTNAPYTYGVTNLTNYTNPASASVSGEFVFHGASKYNTIADMKASGNKFESFLGEDGNNMWKVTDDGELVWHTTKITRTNSTEFNYGAYESKIYSTLIDDIKDEITHIVVGGKTLTFEDGIVKNDDGSLSLTALAKGASGNGVPYMDTTTSASNVFTITVYTKDDTYVFNNVRYQTLVISKPIELKIALDIDYRLVGNNFGFYTLDNDVFYTLDNDVKSIEELMFNYEGASENIKDIYSNAGFAGYFDGAGYTIDFNNTWVADNGSKYGLFGNFSHSGGITLKTPITVKNVALINAKAGGVPSMTLLGKHTKYHDEGGAVYFENIYVNSMGDVPAGLISNPGYNIVMNNVFIDIRKGNQFGDYPGGLFAEKLRYVNETLANGITNFVTLGAEASTMLCRSQYGSSTASRNNVSSVKSVDNGNETFTHTISHGGWGSGNLWDVEFYYAYAGGNQDYGFIDLVQGFKPMFAEINVKYNKSTAIEGAYCANCGLYFTENQEEVNCPNCVVDGVPVALTKSNNLWNETASYIIGRTPLSEVDNSHIASGLSGEIVFKGAKQYYSTTEMANAYNANDKEFASFTGADGNDLWEVVDGILTWVGCNN